jgi:hypothetical protein
MLVAVESSRFPRSWVGRSRHPAERFTSKSPRLGDVRLHDHALFGACRSKENSVAISLIPVKTADGHAELASRQRRLSQRHRTVLLLVDGRRTQLQVRALALQAGAADNCFDELLELGMIALQESLTATVPLAVRSVGEQNEPLHIDIPIDTDHASAKAPDTSPSRSKRNKKTPASGAEPVAAAPAVFDETVESLLPPARTLQPESVLNESQLFESMFHDFDALDLAGTADTPFEEARTLLMRAVRSKAPLAGSLTMMRLRRARTRGELAELIDEVEARIVKPKRSLAAQQILLRARHLLTVRVDAPRAPR